MAKANKPNGNKKKGKGRDPKQTKRLTQATLSAAVGLAMASASGQIGLVQQVARALEEMVVPSAEAQPTPSAPGTPRLGTPGEPKMPPVGKAVVKPRPGTQPSPVADWGQSGGWVQDVTDGWEQKGGWYLVKERQGMVQQGTMRKPVNPQNVRKALEGTQPVVPGRPVPPPGPGTDPMPRPGPGPDPAPPLRR